MSKFLLSLVVLAACGEVELDRHIDDAGSDTGSDVGSGSGNLHLAIELAGDGFGVVTSDPDGISCGTDCSHSFEDGKTVVLTAIPDSTPGHKSIFVGWSGGCTNPGGECRTHEPGTVTAKFALAPNLMFVSSTTSNGNLGGLAGADKTCNTLAAAAGFPGTYVAYLSLQAGNTIVNAPERVGSATGWADARGFTIMNTIDQMSAGTLVNAPMTMETGINVTQTQYPFAWTGTTAAGMNNGACSSAVALSPWAGVQTSATVGLATAKDSTVIQSQTLTCDVQARIYCLGIDRKATVQ